MRGFDIFSFLPEKRHCAPASDATSMVWRRVWHVAATAPHEQRRLLYFGNPALGLTISKTLLARICNVGVSPVFTGFFDNGGGHHAESFLTSSASIRTSIVNFVRGYSKVYPALATRFKRYEFIGSSA